MQKLLDDKVTSVFYSTNYRLGFFQRGSQASWIHLLIVVSEVGMRNLFVLFHLFQLYLYLFILLTLPLWVAIEQRKLHVVGSCRNLGIEDFLHDGFHQRSVVVCDR